MHQESQADSLTVLEERVASRPDSIGDIHVLADAYADRGRWEDAIEAYKAAIALGATDADLHNSLATVYEEVGNLEQAERAYQQAIVLGPVNSLAYCNLGALYEEQQRISEAIQAFEKCLQHTTDPDERSEARRRLKLITAGTSRGRSRLAYRLAAIVLLLGALINVVDVLVTSGPGFAIETVTIWIKSIISVIDFVLVIGLLRLRGRARNFVLLRAVLGAILWLILFPIIAMNDVITAILTSMIQWGFCGALILLLTGQSKTWRLILATGIFVVFSLGLFGLMLILIALARLAGMY